VTAWGLRMFRRAPVSPRAPLRYSMCWEDADVLLDALDIAPGDTCVSIASAGDNTLSLLTRHPARVIAVDANPVQLAALELRIAAYRTLDHAALLELMGSRASTRRSALYAECRSLLTPFARSYWDSRAQAIASGVGGCGKLEAYFRAFRRFVLPVAPGRSAVKALFRAHTREERTHVFDRLWNTGAWRAVFGVFFSKRLLAAFGRERAYFRFADSDVAGHLRSRLRHALTELGPRENPYLSWILTGAHDGALPHALRPEHFDAIRANLDRVELVCSRVEDVGNQLNGTRVDRANLSDVFEYLAPDTARSLFTRVASFTRPGARIAYWNMLVPRRGADFVPALLRPLAALSRRLHAADKAFFYRDFIVEEVA
jgi:S-adenosylmethionine-diacylglycerol 3-amino-3-carboxypropyl transferase